VLSRIFGFFRRRRMMVRSLPNAAWDDKPEDDPGVLVAHNMDGLEEADCEAFRNVASEHSGIPIFHGHVEHGYAVDHAAEPGRCPRCGSDTELQYANFIYATQLALRSMFAPVGHFCTKCPAVVVEEDMIEAGIVDRRFHYERVIGVDYGGQKAPDYFRTWNGENLIYTFDEDENLVGVTPRGRSETRHAPPTPKAASRKHASKKRRDKMAKRSRKKNRKR